MGLRIWLPFYDHGIVMSEKQSRFLARLSLAVIIAWCSSATMSNAQQEVKAPGAQAPGAPLPRYIYNVVAADFAVANGYPLLKSKFNLYDPVGPTMEQFDSNITKMGELSVDTYRIELAWGRQRSGLGTNTGVSGTSSKLEFDFEPVDHLLRQLRTQNVQLLASFGYTPAPLQDPTLPPAYGEGNLKRRETTPPRDVKKFSEAVAAFAEHARKIGLPIGIHEIWNEPDGTYGFYSGTPAQYQMLYEASVEAIRQGDRSAYVAGPASDHHMLWSKSFVDFVAQNKLPLDFYTFHEYGSGELAVRQVNRAAASINRYTSLNKTALSLDEWHDGECCDWCNDDVRNHYEGAPEMLHDFQMLLEKPELASVSWAWWEDPKGRGNGCMGLVTGDGHRKAVFNAWKLYAMMPVDRRAVHLQGPLEAMASSDSHKAGVLIWNRGSYARRLDVHLDNLPFSQGTVKLYRIDEKPEDLVAGESYPFAGKNWSWVDGSIPRGGVLYVEASDDIPAPVTASVDVAKIIRINRYYPARGETASYADFDRKTWIARLGMEGSRQADQEVGALAENLPDELHVSVNIDGKLQAVDGNSLLGVRVDYFVDENYTKSVLFHGPVKGVDVYARSRKAPMPFGTQRPPDVIRAVPDFGTFLLPLRSNAPAHWAGTADLTFIMQDAGADARAKIIVQRAASASGAAEQ
jgi:hypothetical protein